MPLSDLMRHEDFNYPEHGFTGHLAEPDGGSEKTVTLLMGLGIFFMARKGIWIPCIILGVVWAAHLVYFLFFVKTAKTEEGVKQ